MATRVTDTRNTNYPQLEFDSRPDVTYDYSQHDYALMRRILSGDPATGLQLGSTFAKRIVSMVASLMLSSLPYVIVRNRKTREIDEEATAIGSFNQNNQYAQIFKGLKTSLGLGDSYLWLRPDRYLQVLSPDASDPGFSPFDSRINVLRNRVKKIMVSSKDGTRGTVFTNLLLTKELIEISLEKEAGADADTKQELIAKLRLPNLLNEVPAIHLSNNPMDDAVFGVAEFAPVIPLLFFYHQTVMNLYKTQEYHSKPTLKVTGVTDDTRLWAQKTFGLSENPTDDQISEGMHNFFKRMGILVLGDGQEAGYIESAHALEQSIKVVMMAFSMICTATELPQFMFGGIVEGSNATVREQFISLNAYINAKRVIFGDALVQLMKWGLLYESTIDTSVFSGRSFDKRLSLANPEALDELEFIVVWPPIQNSDEQLKLDTAKFLASTGAISRMGIYNLFPSYVPDGMQELQRLTEEFNNDQLPPRPEIRNGAGEDTGNSGDQSASDKNASQRGRDVKGNPGNNSGKNGPGTGKK